MLQFEAYKKQLKNNQLIALLTEYFFFHQPTVHADYTIVLGMNLWQKPASTAVELYQQGMSGKLILCGGLNSKIGRPEAAAMHEFTLAKGIPPADLLVDAASLNTYENISNALDLLRSSAYNTDDITLNIISIHFHARRALLTTEQLFSNAKQMNAVTYPSIHYQASDWYESETGINNVFSELNKLIEYFPEKIPAAILDLLHL